MKAWDIIQNDQVIDTVFFTRNLTQHDVRDRLINHDGYSVDIQVRSAL
jgi:hypothetical protein